MEELARKITRRPALASDEVVSAGVGELPTSSTVDELIEAFLRESVEYATRLHVRDRRSEP
jgi:hypothetical protein